MTDDDNHDEATVFRPAGDPATSTPQPATHTAPPATPDAGDEGATIFEPSGSAPGTAPGPDIAADWASTPPPPKQTFAPGQPAAGGKVGRIEVGSVLNHMFEVTRFIARGGMGEVFEGRNIMSDEKVAIKVILPALAADPKVVAMFRKEAQALLKLQHEALVRYVVQAQEPVLGCEYIVTGFIDGMNLSDGLASLQPGITDLVALARRIASGLKCAHDLGVVHRDISPDNVLLEGKRLDRARVIDFGIVKDTNPDAHTIIDDGFAGKMRFVAPEQLGDFDAGVGAWSDVYSLGLVIVALAQGKPAELGGLPGEAMKKRRNGVDTSAVPQPLRGAIDRMLVADPAKRMRSMDEVLAALDRMKLSDVRKKGAGTAASAPASGAGAASGGLPRPVLIGGGIAGGVLVLAGAAWLALGGKASPPPVTTAPVGGTTTVSLESVQGAVNAALPGIACSWVDVTASAAGSSFNLTGSGVANQPEKVESGLFGAVRQSGATVASSDFSKVAPIESDYCGVLNELQKFRDPGPLHLVSSSQQYEIGTLTKGNDAGKLGAEINLDFDISQYPGNLAIFGIENSTTITKLALSRDEFLSAIHSDGQVLSGKDHYRLVLSATVKPGWAGIVLVTGNGGFTPKMLNDLSTDQGRAAFEQAARANGWKIQIAWYKFVDLEPNGAPPPAAK